MGFLGPTILVWVVSGALGISLVTARPLFKERFLVVAVGIVTGVVITTTLIYLLSAFVLLKPAAVLLALALEGGGVYLISTYTKAWSRFKKLPVDKLGLVVLVILLILFSLIANKILIDNTAVGEGMLTGVINAYGDIGWHMANITSLAYEQTVPPADPIMAGNRLTYPFLANFFSAVLLVVGANYSQAVNIPAMVLIPLALFLLYCLARELTGNKWLGLIVMLLFMFGGGTLGWVRFTSDLAGMTDQTWLEKLANLPRNYSGHSDDIDGFNLVNPLVSLLLPQRSFMFGMSLAFILLLLITCSNQQQRQFAFVLAGVIAGLLPLFHAHTVIALMPIILLLLIFEPHKDWWRLLVTTTLVGLPGVLYYLTGKASASAMPHWQLGWMSYDNNVVVYWLKNSGLLLPVVGWGLFLPAARRLKLLAAAGLVLFGASNLWLFAAWEWDNTKLLVYWLIFCLPLATYVVGYYWHKVSWYGRGVVVALVIFHLLSGGLDVLRLALPNTPTWLEWDNGGVAMAKLIRAKVPRQNSVLTAPYHNSPAALSGRSIYLGFPGHVWTHGGNHQIREAAVQSYFEGQIDSLPEHQPQYVLVGPVERSFYPNLYIRPQWQLVGRSQDYELYQILTSVP